MTSIDSNDIHKLDNVNSSEVLFKDFYDDNKHFITRLSQLYMRHDFNNNKVSLDEIREKEKEMEKPVKYEENEIDEIE